jgi:hypothetical protein
MALNPKTALSSRNPALNAAFDLLNSGHLLIYDGTQPTDADTVSTSQVLGADLGLNATAFAAAAAGSKSANAITTDSSANASINPATWGAITVNALRTTAGSGMDFSVGTSGANMNLNSIAISSGAAVSCSSLAITQAA